MSRATLGLRTETKAHDPLDTAFGEYAAAHHEVVSHPEIHAYQFTQALAMSGALYHHGHTLELYIKGCLLYTSRCV